MLNTLLTQRNITIGLSLLALGFGCYFFNDIVAYVLIAWVLSLLGRPMFVFFLTYLRISRFSISRGGAAMLTLCVFILLILGVFAIFVPIVVMQANTLSGIDYPAMAKALQEPFGYFDGKAHEWGLLPAGQTASEKVFQSLSQFFTPSAISHFFGNVISAAGNLSIGFVSVLFICFYFLTDSKLFNQIMMVIVPRGYESQANTAIHDSVELLYRYFRGLVVQILFVAIFVTSLLAILGVPNAVLIGVLTALLNVVPYIGPIVSTCISVLLTISSTLELDFFSQVVPMLAKVAIVIGSMQLLDNFIVQPYIFSNSVMAHPLEIFFVVMMGAQIGGIIGMVIAIPVYTVLRVIAHQFWSQYKVVGHLTSRLNDDK